jgi:hypothetical protein
MSDETTTTTPGAELELEPVPAPGEFAFTIRRSALKIGDMRFLNRVARAQLAYMQRQPWPEDAPTQDELDEFMNRAIEGGLRAFDDLPIDALPQVWGAIRAVVFGRRPQDPNSAGPS